MSKEFNFTNGPMTTQRAMNNLLAALNIAQGKGCFNLRESAFVYSSLQALNEFVKKHDSENNITETVIKDPEPIQKKLEKVPKPIPQKKAQEKPKKINKPLPDINLENDEPVSEIIEI